MPDEITLTFPRERPFHSVAHLVLGGLAARFEVTFDSLEDLQLAVAGLLDRPDDSGDVTLRLQVDGDTIRATLGPFDDASLRADLAPEDAGVGLARLLDTVVDRFTLVRRDGVTWVELTKTVQAAPAP